MTHLNTSTEGGAGQAAEVATEGAREVAAKATDGARDVTSTATDGARQVASTATEQVSNVARETSEQARDLVQQAQSHLHDQAESQTERLADGIRGAGRQVRALTTGRPQEAGVAADWLQQLSQSVDQLADRLEERGFDGTVEDVRGFARRRPGLFLAGAAATGFVLTRLGRGAQAAAQQEPVNGDGRTVDAPVAPSGTDDQPGAA